MVKYIVFQKENRNVTNNSNKKNKILNGYNKFHKDKKVSKDNVRVKSGVSLTGKIKRKFENKQIPDIINFCG